MTKYLSESSSWVSITTNYFQAPDRKLTRDRLIAGSVNSIIYPGPWRRNMLDFRVKGTQQTMLLLIMLRIKYMVDQM